MWVNVILSFMPLLGLIAGYTVRKTAPEEVAPGKPYFLAMQRTIAAIITGLLLYVSPWSWTTLIPLFLGAAAGYIFRWRYSYLALAMVVALSLTPEILLLTSALLFLYGLPFGTHMIAKKPIRTFIHHALLYAIPFIIISIPFSLTYLPAFVAGALFLRE